MEYVQMTLNDWVEMKQKLKRELMGVKQSFVRIGFMLRQIEDQKLYGQDGYKSIAEFAKAELGLEPSTTSRFISINREYSVDGYSEILSPEYAELGRSQLEEMLKLPEDDRKMVQPETSRQDIRDLKKFNKTEPETGIADDLRQVIENFFKDNADILNAVFSEKDLGTDAENTKRMAEIINPAGNRSYKKGLFFMIMYEDKIAVKKFGSSPKEMTWAEFMGITIDIFGDSAAGGKTWQRYFGNEEGSGTAGTGKKAETLNAEGSQKPDAKNVRGQQELHKKEPESAEKGSEGQQEPSEKEQEGQQAEEERKKEPEEQQGVQGEPDNSIEDYKETGVKEIAPAQKKLENTELDGHSAEPGKQREAGNIPEEEQEGSEIPGQMEITKDMPEYCPDFMNEPEVPDTEEDTAKEIAPAQKKPENTESEADFQGVENTEEIDRPYGSRKAYLDTLTEFTAAIYIADHIRDMKKMTFAELIDAKHWERWLKAEVDDNGEEIDTVE